MRGWRLLKPLQIPPPPSLKKLPNKVIELLSLPLLYSPSFLKLPNKPLVRSSAVLFLLSRPGSFVG